jgi:ubiquinone/menaquinone biosynthesis C-methylase UbiE
MAGLRQDPGWADDKRREIRRYWDAHPIATDTVSHAKGTRESFDTIYGRWEADAAGRQHELAELCRGKRVLEVGCGIGIVGRFLSQSGARYHAVDLSRNSLRLARTHFQQHGLPTRLTNGDGASLPFRDDEFDVFVSFGVLMLAPDVASAFREAVRVTKPGGTVRIMVYHRHSYHYLLVDWLARPLIWLMLKLPFLRALLRFAPEKFRQLFEISRSDGFDRQRLLWASTDTSFPGQGNFHPFTHFLTEGEMRALFPGLTDLRFQRTALKYFPLPFLGRFVEERWGFFLTLTGTKRAARAPD